MIAAYGGSTYVLALLGRLHGYAQYRRKPKRQNEGDKQR
jgi:hypothetical protein